MGSRIVACAFSIVLTGIVLTASVVPCAAATGDRGQPASTGSKPLANDCLFILRTAIGLSDCELCVCDVDGNADIVATDAQRCLRIAVGQDVALACPDCPGDTTTTTTPSSTSTTTLPPPNPGCPGYVEWTTHARFGPACETNADCDVGVCDAAIGRCLTKTRRDIGWSGLGHGGDFNEGATERMIVTCAAESAPCGECAVVGYDPSPGNCRCANDTRSTCDQPFIPDSDDCASCVGGANNGKPCKTPPDCPGGSCSGAAECQCFASPPVPVSAGGTPFCMLPRFAPGVSGTVDVDSGASEVHLDMRIVTYLGSGVLTPCPTCGGTCSNDEQEFCVRDEDCSGGGTCTDDPVANDGVRGGVCSNDAGTDAGKPCDKGTFNSTFPNFELGPDGGWTSLDCIPANGVNVTGQGLRLESVRTTGTASLSADLPCTGGDCPCFVCTNDLSEPCHSDQECAALPAPATCTLATGSRPAECSDNSDCASADAGNCVLVSSVQRCQYALSVSCESNADCQDIPLGTCRTPTCSAVRSGETRANGCTDGNCSATGDESGECTTGPDLQYCSDVVRPDGRGIFPCLSDEDCLFGSIGVTPPHSCNLEERLPCFPDPIVATGSADPVRPLLAEAFCMGTLSSSGQNAAFGLPGPVRVKRQTTLRSYCDSDPARLYSPGVGGCED